jgi:hypothetical protein
LVRAPTKTVKKPLKPTEPRPKKKIQAAAPKPPTKTREEPKTKVKEVKQWDFNKPTNITGPPAARSGESLDVDPELDGMLAKLEMDEDFMKLSDNDQVTWLESLFFLDTPSKQASSGLVKPRPNPVPQQSSRRPEKSTMRSSKVDMSPSVSAKSLSIQSNSGRLPSASVAAPAAQADENDNCPPGLNKDKCALAMSFFANDSKSSTGAGGKKVVPSKKQSITAHNDDDDDDDDADLPAVHNATAKPFVKPPPERAYFEPEASELPEDDDEEEEDMFPAAFQSRQKKPSVSSEAEGTPPPVPARSGEPKQLMLRLMKNATNALRN